jgi:predicted transposase YbfD/YdcC
MEKEQSPRLIDHFSELKDPRIERNKLHKLIDILTIAICAVICNADTWEDIEEFAKSKEEWFRKFLELPNGIPSHDTLRRVFIRLKPEEFQAGFLSWVRALRPLLKEKEGEVVSIDGKTARRSFDAQKGMPGMHMVSAWANHSSMVLAQLRVQEKSNEIDAIPELLKLLELSGCVVTIDAMGCQKQIAKDIREKGADYVLALKGNQGTLHENVKLYLDDALARNFRDVPHDSHTTVEKDHGRFERREYYVTSQLSWLEEATGWQDLASIGMVKSTREINGHQSTDIRYFIASLPPDARQFAHAVRGHWAVENSLHWVMDIAFREDESRIRKDHSPANFAVLRHIALNLIKQEKTSKRSVKGKRLKAGWDNTYLERVVFGA